MGNSTGYNKKVIYNPEKIKVEARLYFQDSNLKSKVFFKNIPQRERYRFGDNEFVEVYVNDILITRGRESALKLYNTICKDIQELNFKATPILTINHGKDVMYTVKVLVSGEFVIFLGNVQTIHFITNSIDTLNKIMPSNTEYKYTIDRHEKFDILHDALNRFSEIV